MTRNRARLEAIATVCIPSALIWGIIFCFFPAEARTDLWPVFLILFAIPLPLIFLVYHRYRNGPSYGPTLKSSKYHFWTAAAFAALAIVNTASAIFESHRKGWDFAARLAIAAGWLVISGDNVRKALKARNGIAANIQ